MADPGERPRTTFRFPRVEFDLTGLLLGALACLSAAAVWHLLAVAFDLRGPYWAAPRSGPVVGVPERVEGAVALQAAFRAQVEPLLRFPGADWALDRFGAVSALLVRPSEADPKRFEGAGLGLAAWQIAAVVAAHLLVWSVAGGALARVYALRKAKDRTVPMGEAVAFAFASLRQFVLAPVFMFAAGAFFFALVALCGAGTALPYAGPVLQVLLHPLALLAGVVVTVVAVGGVLGYPMTQAAVAVERNGSLDAVSRTYSYVFSRPLLFAFGSLVVLAVAAAIPSFLGWGLGVVREGIALGAGYDDRAVPALRAGIDAGVSLQMPRIAADAEWSVVAWTWGAWAFFGLAGLLVRGFVVSYLVGGLVDVYFLLREEVDGVPPSEAYEEEAAASLGEPLPGEPADGRPEAPGDGGPAPGLSSGA